MSSPPTRRVHAYIDGFNLYHGLKSKRWRRYYWLDLWKLCEGFLREGQTLVGVSYFTARVKSPRQSLERQAVYLEALATHRPQMLQVFGHYLAKTVTCRQCASSWPKHEEKMTDVNIACQLLAGAIDDAWDTAVLVSGDSDLTPPIEIVRERYPAKRVIVAQPPARRSQQLIEAAHGTFVIGQDRLKRCPLPLNLRNAQGHPILRPEDWV